MDRVAAAALVVALVNANPRLWPDLNRLTLRDTDEWLCGGVNWPWVLQVLERKARLHDTTKSEPIGE